MLNPIITPPRVPLVDANTGLISRAWYLFFLSLNNVANDVVDNPVVGPSAESLIASYDALLQTLTQEVQTQPTQEGALDQIAELQKQTEALALAPPVVVAGQALTEVDDTNVTMTLSGNPTAALLEPVLMTLGWNGQLGVSRGGTGVSTTPSNGQLLIGNGTGYAVANLTAGTNISITNSAGGITINSSNPGGTVTSVGLSAPTGFSVSGSPVTSSGTLALSFAAGYSLPTNASQTNWDTAFSERRQWDGGNTGLVAATGRTSLGATTVGSNLFTLANPSAIRYMRINADNSVSTLDAATFRTAIGAGTGNGTVTSVATGTGLTGGPITGSGTISFSTAAVGTWAATPSSANLAAAMTDETGSGLLVFATRPSFANTIGVGGAAASASGAGVSFPATVSLSTDPNTLDDYEEGTWTPTLTNVTVGNGIISDTYYIKIGQVVHIGFNFVFGSTTTVAAGVVDVSGLPFAVGGNGSGAAWLFDATAGGYTLPAVLPTSTSGFFRIGRGTTVGTDQLTNTLPFIWAVNDRINFAGTYRTTA